MFLISEEKLYTNQSWILCILLMLYLISLREEKPKPKNALLSNIMQLEYKLDFILAQNKKKAQAKLSWQAQR